MSIWRQVELPVGYADAGGLWRRAARVRKMRGHEEALLYDAALSSGQLVSLLVASCLKWADDEGDIAPETVVEMYSADRNYLLMEIRRFTLGDALSCAYVCPDCAGDVSVLEDLSQAQVRRCAGEAPAPTRLTLEDAYRDREGVTHAEIVLRLPRGADEEFIASTADRDPLRARDVLILRCIERFGTLSRAALEAYGVRILRDLTLGDRNRIYRALEADAPGVDLRRTLRCPHCGGRFEAALDAANFFLPAPSALA